MAEIFYTEAQRQAIAHRGGNLLILACAGSGKTEVISKRIANLVKDGAAKGGIVAFTFTDRAAEELKARVRQHLEAVIPDDPSLGDMYVGTIHSFCLDTLRQLDPAFRKFEVMDEARQIALIMTNFQYSADRPTAIGLDRLRIRSRNESYWETIRTFRTTLNVIHQKAIPDRQINDPVLLDAIQRYQRAAYGSPNYFFDFDSIIATLVSLLRSNSSHLEKIRSRIQHLVVDEYQDVDDRQEDLIALLTGKGSRATLTVVGDDDQAIYGWRGAQIRNILDFDKRYPNVSSITLNDNFRSTLAIVELANAAIRHIPERNRIPKEMIARRPLTKDGETPQEQATEPHDIQVRALSSDIEEADWVAERALQLRGAIVKEKDGSSRAIDYADMAILVRSVRNAGHLFAEALRRRDIPVVVRGTGGLFDHPEVRLIYAGFSLLARAAYFRRTEGKIDRLESELDIREEVRALMSACGSALPFASSEKFLEWIAAKREELDRRNVEVAPEWRLPRRIYPQDVFQEMVNALGAHRSDRPFTHQVLFNWGRLSELITEFESVHQWITPSDLHSLCIFLSGWAAESVDEGGLDEAFTPNAVQILTVHAAKGLEWPVVFASRISSGNFPSQRRNQGPATFLAESLFDRKEYASGDEGERRLWYVAITRCQKFLNITSPNRRGKKPTVFFNEIKHDLVSRHGFAPDPIRGTPQARAEIALLPTTYSDLNCFWRCEHEYELRSVMGFSPGVAESYGYGQQIHNILAEIHLRAREGETFNDDKVSDLVENRFHLRYTRDGETRKPLTILRESAKKALSRYVRETESFGKYILEPEKAFEFVDKESDALISGTIDLLEQIKISPSGKEQRFPVALVDFKTTQVRNWDTYKKAKQNAEKQLQLYSVAVQHAFGMSAKKARAHFLTPHPLTESDRASGLSDVIEIDITPSAQDSIRKEVQVSVRRIQSSLVSQTFGKTGIANGACRKCDFREICFGYVKYKELDRESRRAGTYEQEREDELRLAQEDLDAGETP